MVAILSTTLDQPDRQQNAVTAKGPSQAVTSLNREFLALLVSEEAAEIGRAIAQIIRGDGWHEAKSSAVLAEALIAWLGHDAVQPMGFYADGTGTVEVVARVGHYYITGYGIENENDLTIDCCQRHRARFSQSRLEDLDLAVPNTRFTMASPLARRAAEQMGVLLAEEIDPEIARVVLGV